MGGTDRAGRFAGVLWQAVLLFALGWSGAAHGALETAFRVRVGTPNGPSPPVFDTRGRAFLVEDGGAMAALSVDTGHILWTAPVRCGTDLIRVVKGRVVCVAAARGRVRVLDAATGRLRAHIEQPGGPFAVAEVDGSLLLHDLRSGRLLGYDLGELRWRFDHGTEADVGHGDGLAPITLAGRYYFTEDEWRTLWALEAQDASIHPVAHSDVPVRIDRGADARVTHGLIVSRETHGMQAFDLGRMRRAWRFDVRELLDDPHARIARETQLRDRLLVLVEVDGDAASATEGGLRRWLQLLWIELRTGEILASVPVALHVPLPALGWLATPSQDSCSSLSVTGLGLVDEWAVLTLATPCVRAPVRRAQGWVVGVDMSGRRDSWVTPPRTAERLVTTEDSAYGIWARPGTLHATRVLREIDPETGAVLSEGVIGYTATWALAREFDVWVGTTAGTVVTFRR